MPGALRPAVAGRADLRQRCGALLPRVGVDRVGETVEHLLGRLTIGILDLGESVENLTAGVGGLGVGVVRHVLIVPDFQPRGPQHNSCGPQGFRRIDRFLQSALPVGAQAVQELQGIEVVRQYLQPRLQRDPMG